MTVRLRPFADAVVALGHAAGSTRPWNDPHQDVVRKEVSGTGASVHPTRTAWRKAKRP